MNKILKTAFVRNAFSFSSAQNIKYANSLEFLFHEHSLKLKQPYFQVHSSQIEILDNPIDYFIELNVKSFLKKIGYFFRKELNHLLIESI